VDVDTVQSLATLFVAGLSANQFDPMSYKVILAKLGFYGLFAASLLLFLTHAELGHVIHWVNKFVFPGNWQKLKGADAP
jgi:hypothetical protein